MVLKRFVRYVEKNYIKIYFNIYCVLVFDRITRVGMVGMDGGMDGIPKIISIMQECLP